MIGIDPEDGPALISELLREASTRSCDQPHHVVAWRDSYPARELATRRTIRKHRPGVPAPQDEILHVVRTMVTVATEGLYVFLHVRQVAGLAPGWYEPAAATLNQVAHDSPRLTHSWKGDAGPAVQIVLAADIRSISASDYASTIARAGRAAFSGWLTAMQFGYDGAVLAECDVQAWIGAHGSKLFASRPLVSLSLTPRPTGK